MTPKEKAEELLDKMTMEIGKFNAKQCALIAVDEMMKLAIWTEIGVYDYLTEVKQEIEKL